MPTISVIVPIYNVEQYLCKCLDSILNQTFVDFELLLINDGSLDRSGQICDEYAQNDTRIRVFHKKNGGVSSARNLGLDNAKGKWIAFIDSDDWVDNSYFQHLLEGDENVELRAMGIMKQNNNKKWVKMLHNEELFLTDNFWKFYKLYLDHYIVRSPYLKLFLLSVINKAHIRFNLCLSFGEDTIFSLQYLQQIKSILVKNYAEYYYRYTPNSLVKTTISERYENFNFFLEKVLYQLLIDKRLIVIINNFLKKRYLALCVISITHLYLHQNLETKERRKSLSTCFKKLNDIDFSYILIAWFQGKLALCIVCLYYIPIVIADTIFLFLFWLRRNILKSLYTNITR
jgi:glycosyltransferase involved in cell wall biosynthesis